MLTWIKVFVFDVLQLIRALHATNIYSLGNNFSVLAQHVRLEKLSDTRDYGGRKTDRPEL